MKPPKAHSFRAISNNMKQKYGLLLALLLPVFSAFATSFSKQRLWQSNVVYVGRTQTLADGSVSYNWVGTYLETQFSGSSIAMQASAQGKTYHNVMIDGRLVRKILLQGTQPHRIVLAEGLGKGWHTLRLQQCTEGEHGRTTIHGFLLNNGEQLRKVPRRQRFIEFYGDSYTCGYGTEGTSHDEPFTLETENCNQAYACIIARYFDADYALVAHSGRGILRNYGAPKTQSEGNMFDKHNRLFDADEAPRYDFSAYKPQLVVVNLGTNDFSPLAIPSPEAYVSQYKKLLQSLRTHYGNVPVFCIRPQSASRYLQLALDLLERETAADAHVFVSHSMNNIIDDATDYGASWHPNYRGQRKVAMSLIPQIAHIMGWEAPLKVVE